MRHQNVTFDAAHIVYVITIHIIILENKNNRLSIVNTNKYLPTFTSSFIKNLNEIKLAIDAIIVPKPPRLVPTGNACA